MSSSEKPQNTNSLIFDMANNLQRSIAGEVHIDKAARILYSTDASIYQIEPIGVIFPRSLDDLSAIVEIAAQYKSPILARGSGSSLAGQAIGHAWIVDCSRYLNRLVEINPEEKTAVVEPGVILDDLNRQSSLHGLRFGPDPASAERATMGGSIANNAAGANSIIYGMAADHLISAEVVLADGSLATFGRVKIDHAFRKAGIGEEKDFSNKINDTSMEESKWGINFAGTLEANIYRSVLYIRHNYAAAIQNNWPNTWRRASGYNLNYLLPWSPSKPPLWFMGKKPYPPIDPDQINISTLLAGSEGTLAVFRRLVIRLVPKEKHTVLCVLAYPSIPAACDDVSRLLDHSPSAVELIPKSLIRLAQKVPAYARELAFVGDLTTTNRKRSSLKGDVPEAILVIELSGDNLTDLKIRAQHLGAGGFIAYSPESQKRVWALRKAGLGILMSRTDDIKPVAFIEDLSVPINHLGEFAREMEHILASHGTQGDFYAHASAGCLHLRPLINLKSSRGINSLRTIAGEAVKLTMRLGGTVSGEHGDGLSRSEWLQSTFGKEVVHAFKTLKSTADPEGILNPGKIVNAQPMDVNLRVQAISPDLGDEGRSLKTVFDYSRQSGFVNAVEQCNGAGVCRKFDGVMCPSFQATQDEMHSTRGRANLLRALIYGLLPDTSDSEQIIFDALSLCLACKGCKGECPSAVDMAKLKYEFLNQYYSQTGLSSRHRPIRDYLFAFIGTWAGIGFRFAPVIDKLPKNLILGFISRKFLGISPKRSLPLIQPESFHEQAKKYLQSKPDNSASEAGKGVSIDCIFLSDPFIEYFQPEVGMAALKALLLGGYQVKLLPVIGAGRTLITKGFLQAGRKHALKVISAIKDIDPEGKIPVVGVEPSEIYTLCDEYLDLFGEDKDVQELARRSYTIEELLVRPVIGRTPGIMRIATTSNNIQPNSNLTKPKVILHGHCYQKVKPPAEDGYPTGLDATVRMLEIAGYRVSTIEAGCCGMAGAFGYESEHYQVSIQIGELALFPAIREAKCLDEQVILAACGVSCQSQIKDGTNIQAVHPIMLI